MSTASSWHYNKKRLNEALAAWRATDPSRAMQDVVNTALMDLIKDPLGWGDEDLTTPGVFHRTITATTGERIGILYAIPNPSTSEVGIADIRTGS